MRGRWREEARLSRSSKRGLLELVATALCAWAALWHTPAGALARELAARLGLGDGGGLGLLSYYAAPASRTERPTPELLTGGTTPESFRGALGLGRGLAAAWARSPEEVRARAPELARRYGLPPPATPAEFTALVTAAARELGGVEAGVLACFTGFEVAAYAGARVRAEGREASLGALAERLPPGSAAARAAGSAFALGTAYGLDWPVAEGTRVSSPFGDRRHPVTGRQQAHWGIDFALPTGTPVRAVGPGIVTRASEDGVNGRMVVIDHGAGVVTVYCHNEALLVRAGERVSRGQLVANSGNTGRSTGPHLHYQLELARRPEDPQLFR